MKGMTVIVKQVTKLVIGFILLYSAYVILYGHLSPGGGFVGGVMLACGLILLILAFGKDYVNTMIRDRSLTGWDCFGALAFLALMVLGYAAGGFVAENILARPGNFRLASGGIIPPVNIAIGIKVGACMAGAFVALVVFPVHHDSGTGDRES